ncbi:MAG: protein kinase [Paludibacteraceae bacterium]|nr:protein kinase [Paludibacteraceae bacterium]
MDTNSFTSGPIRPLSSQELGVNHLTDYELLSDSGHNLVYRAQMGGKWVVLKAAKPTEGEQTRNQLLLEREFEIMHRLDSIYVVQTIAMVNDPQLGRAILMEYVHGRSLDKFVAGNPTSTERRRVADELMEALIFLHERQIVHGDLKPSNILITDSGNHVRLIDFGFADNEAYIAKNIGTSPSISSPDQLPTDVLKPERDIYALGKMLALLFPHSLKPVIRRCLASDRSRYISVRQVRAALHRYWRMRWSMPWILAITTIIAFVIVFQPNPTETAQISEIQTDTEVVVPAKPAVDSIWLNLKYEIDKQYTSLYITYADSLSHMPEKTMNAAIYKLSGYANELLKEHKYLTDAYPQYEDSLQELYLAHLVRDHNRLQSICEDYPMIYSNKYSNKTE